MAGEPQQLGQGREHPEAVPTGEGRGSLAWSVQAQGPQRRVSRLAVVGSSLCGVRAQVGKAMSGDGSGDGRPGGGLAKGNTERKMRGRLLIITGSKQGSPSGAG